MNGEDIEMERDKLLGLGAKVVQTVATNTFFGAALYVNIVETPARKSLKSASAVIDHFQATFPRAKNMQGPLAALATSSGLLGNSNYIVSTIFSTLYFSRLVLGQVCGQ